MEEDITVKKADKQISHMINSGANIIDVGGESTRPGSKEINTIQEWKRVEFVMKKFKKNIQNFVYQLIQENQI